MNVEKKTYSIIGKLTIGTDEYRDLVEGLSIAKFNFELKDRECWNEHRRNYELESQLKEMTEKYERLNAFITSKDEIKKQYLDFGRGFEKEDE